MERSSRNDEDPFPGRETLAAVHPGSGRRAVRRRTGSRSRWKGVRRLPPHSLQAGASSGQGFTQNAPKRCPGSKRMAGTRGLGGDPSSPCGEAGRGRRREEKRETTSLGGRTGRSDVNPQALREERRGLAPAPWPWALVWQSLVPPACPWPVQKGLPTQNRGGSSLCSRTGAERHLPGI